MSDEPGTWWLVHIPENHLQREEVCRALQSRFPWFTVNPVAASDAHVALLASQEHDPSAGPP